MYLPTYENVIEINRYDFDRDLSSRMIELNAIFICVEKKEYFSIEIV